VVIITLSTLSDKLTIISCNRIILKNYLFETSWIEKDINCDLPACYWNIYWEPTLSHQLIYSYHCLGYKQRKNQNESIRTWTALMKINSDEKLPPTRLKEPVILTHETKISLTYNIECQVTCVTFELGIKCEYFSTEDTTSLVSGSMKGRRSKG